MSSVDPSAGPSRRPGWILAVACGVQFMVILDLAVVNVALPSIQSDLGIAQSDLQWVVIIYGLVFGGLLLLGGRAADLFGVRPTLVSGFTLFTAASLGAGLSDGFASLVASRAVQGLGAALAAPAALAALAATFPQGAARNRALAVFGAVAGSAASGGLIVSGVLSDGPGWEWIFLVNVPIGVALIGLALRHIPAGSVAARRRPDLLGSVTVTAGLLAVIYAISTSAEDGWTSAATLGSLAAGIALLVAFVLVERAVTAPLVPPAMFRRRTLTGANLVALLAFGSFYATIFVTTLFMQQVLGYSATRAGVAWIAATATAFVVALRLSARVLGRFGAGTTLVVGQLVVAVAALLLSRADAGASYWVDLFPGFVLLGIGIGVLRMATQAAAFVGIEPRVMGLAGGMIETARELGGALGTAIAATVAAARASQAAGSGVGADELSEGLQRGSLIAAGLAVAAAVAAGLVLAPAERSAHRAGASGPGGTRPYRSPGAGATDGEASEPAALTSTEGGAHR